MDKSEIFCSIVNIANKDKFINIKNVLMNSKEVKGGDLFVAIRGGNDFANEALKKGAYVVYDNKDIKIEDEFIKRAFLVEDSITFLQEFARKWRKNLNISVVGITGSNGKTTVKDMVYSLLSREYKGKKTEGNYNNHIGLPFTLLRSEKDDKFMILEMGMSGFGEIDLLGSISSPDISVITNIGESHLEYLKTKENVFKAKTEILPHTGKVLVLNGNDSYLKNIEDRNFKLVKVLNNGGNDFTVSPSDIYYGDIDFNEEGTTFSLAYSDKDGKESISTYKTNVLGEHNILNLSIAIAVAREFGISDDSIRETVKNILLTDMRFQKISKGNITYINDAYNASPMSMEKSLETFSNIYNDREKIAVLGDMLELGEKERELHANLFNIIEKSKIDKIYLYGERMAALYERLTENSKAESMAGKEVEYFSDKAEIRKRLSHIKAEKAVLIKASRGIKLEEVIEEGQFF